MNDKILMEKPFYLDEKQIEWVHSTLEGMDTKQKVGQLFCMAVSQNNPADMEKMVMEYQIGGYMCRALPTKDIVEINRFMQSRAKIPMLVAANLECGPDGISREATAIASSLEIGATHDAEYAGKLGEACAKAGAALGVNWAFAPVADIEYNWRNPIVGTRAFGNEPKFVAECAVKYVEKAQSNGLAASVKHFPGDGMDERDQHLVTSINSLTCEEWDESFGQVYKACIDAGAMTVMTGHIMLPSYSRLFCPGIRDEELLPATCSPELLQKLLRKKLGFQGLIVSDATNMAGSLVLMDRRKLLVQMIQAGCDMLLFTHNTEEDIESVFKGIQSGAITRERLDDAVTKILALKAALKLPEKKETGEIMPSLEHAEMWSRWAEYKTLCREIADKAVTLVKDTQKLLPVLPYRYRRIYLYVIADAKEPGGDEKGVAQTLKKKLTEQGFEVTCHDNDKPMGAFGHQISYEDMANSYDLILYVFNIATYSNKTTVRINWKNLNYPLYIPAIPTMAVSFANPYHLVDIPRMPTMINAYKFNEETVDAFIEKIQGKSAFFGKNPVNPFCGMWDAKL